MSAPHRYAARAHGSYVELDLGDRDVLRLPDRRTYTDPDQWPGLCSRWLEDRSRALLGAHHDVVLAALGDLDADILRLLLDDVADAFGVTHTAQLVFMLERYGDAIDADLASHYTDVAVTDVFTGRRTPDELLSLIKHLPRASRMGDATQQDDELAEMLEDAPVADADGPRVSEFTPTVEAITRLIFGQNVLIDMVGGVLKNPAKLPPPPVPVTARDRLAARRDDEQIAELFADIIAAQSRWTDEHPEPPEED